MVIVWDIDGNEKEGEIDRIFEFDLGIKEIFSINFIRQIMLNIGAGDGDGEVLNRESRKPVKKWRMYTNFAVSEFPLENYFIHFTVSV